MMSANFAFSDKNIQPTHQLQVFVAGLPAGVDPVLVLNFFRKLGNVRLCKPSSVKEAETKKRKGHCVINCLDPDTFDKIISIGSFKLYGRNVSAMPLKSGHELVQQNREMTEARVILKKVPKWFLENELRSFLELNYGTLKSLHRFVLDETKLETNTKKQAFYKKFDSYSAIFDSKEAARFLADKKILYLSDRYAISVEMYQPKKNRSDRHEASIRQPSLEFTRKHDSVKHPHEPQCVEDVRSKPTTAPEVPIHKLPSYLDHLEKPTRRDYFREIDLTVRPHFAANRPKPENFANYCFRYR